MNGADLEQAGYARALWIPSTEPHWLRPGGHSVCSETEALRELAELLGEEADA
jgi:hypothetical protein